MRIEVLGTGCAKCAKVEEVVRRRLDKHPAHRFGQASELGHTCAFLCSVHAGYINGQNILLDGGSFPGVF